MAAHKKTRRPGDQKTRTSVDEQQITKPKANNYPPNRSPIIHHKLFYRIECLFDVSKLCVYKTVVNG